MTDQSTAPLRDVEIFPKKFRIPVTRADICHWCLDPFAEPKRKCFVIMDVTNPERGWPWGLVSICFECFKRGEGASKDSGLELERKNGQCQGCGEPISIPRHQYRGTWRWFSHGVCSMRCYQRAYRKRRRLGGGSAIDWKWKGDGPRFPRCEACKAPLPKGRRRDGKFCSNRCRQWMYRRRHAP
jgi:hypothetical protein